MDLAKIQKKHGKKFGAHFISTAEDDEALARIPYGVSSQSLCFDLMIGRPGFPAGRLTEIVGLTHTGKSTIAYHTLAECQRLGGEAVLLETENAYERERLQEIGVDTKKLSKFEPETLEQVLEIIMMVMEEVRVSEKFKGPLVIVVDSIAGTQTQVEKDSEFGERQMGIAARVMSNGLRKLIRPLAQHKAVLIFLNQLYSSMQMYGEKYVSYGGTQIHKSSSLRVWLKTRKADLVRKGTTVLGQLTNAETIKNKIGYPHQSTKYLLNFDHGIDPCEDLWRAALQMKLLTISQGSFKFTIGGKSKQLTKVDFPSFVNDKFKTPVALRERLTQVAIEQKLMKPYGG